MIPSFGFDLPGRNWMARALSSDLRSRVLAASSDGMSARAAAARFGIGIDLAPLKVSDELRPLLRERPANGFSV